MMREEGRVVQVEGEHALVASWRTKSCGGCHGESSCNTLSGGLGNRETHIRALNRAGAGVGERVILEMDEGQFLRISFRVYIVPIIAMLLVGGVVRWWLLDAGFGQRAEGLAGLAGLVGLAVTFIGLRHYGRQVEGEGAGQPVVARVVREAPACPPGAA